MEDKLSFSIVTPSYNSAGALEETILSVLSQGGVDLEYIIVDGASTDDTLSIIKKYAEQDDRIRWVSEPDLGIYDAMNKGWAMADEGSRILFLGAGDKLISLPSDPVTFEPEDVVIGSVKLHDGVYISHAGGGLKLANTVHHQGLLVPKSIHPAPPFDLRYRLYADFDFNQRLLKKGCHFVFSDELWASFEPGGVSSKKDILELMRVIAGNFGYFYCLLAIVGFPLRALSRMLSFKPHAVS